MERGIQQVLVRALPCMLYRQKTHHCFPLQTTPCQSPADHARRHCAWVALSYRKKGHSTVGEGSGRQEGAGVEGLREKERSRTERNGAERSGTVQNGAERCRTERNGAERCRTVQNGAERCRRERKSAGGRSGRVQEGAEECRRGDAYSWIACEWKTASSNIILQ